MKARKTVLITCLLVALIASTSGSAPTAPDNPAAETFGPDVVHLSGVRNISFGDTEGELTARGVLQIEAEPADCAAQIAGLDTVGPVFDRERLVLMWVSPPMHTPEGVTVGTSVNTVHARYPAATALIAPQGTYRFDGLLAREGDRAFLFLHDGRVVRKTIAGYAAYAQKLFDEGFGLC
ncbi:hypothetical protein OG792_00115 [Micromonospora sp. NBC_01699]|uniref:hypothetical protein n=1 Tax=Micromonospora sp. NBC_01699 TaxID=2975984 RepID=UPI002E29E264|nr:hypothetical protein [Micromonospora sp. NBC_01699]